MIPTIQQDILRKLSSICELSPDVRVGQVMAHLGLLAEELFDRSLGDIDDHQLLRVLERHEAELSRRQSSVA